MKTLLLALAKYVAGLLFLFLMLKVVEWMFWHHGVALINVGIVASLIIFFIREPKEE